MIVGSTDLPNIAIAFWHIAATAVLPFPKGEGAPARMFFMSFCSKASRTFTNGTASPRAIAMASLSLPILVLICASRPACALTSAFMYLPVRSSSSLETLIGLGESTTVATGFLVSPKMSLAPSSSFACAHFQEIDIVFLATSTKLIVGSFFGSPPVAAVEPPVLGACWTMWSGEALS